VSITTGGKIFTLLGFICIIVGLFAGFWIGFFWLIGFPMLLIGAALYIWGYREEARKHPGTVKLKQPKEAQATTKETIIKEVVMIPCPYCKGLMPQTATTCPNCGAPHR